MLSRTAITPLLTYIQRFKCKYVTGDSKYSFYNSYVEAIHLNLQPLLLREQHHRYVHLSPKHDDPEKNPWHP